MHPIEGLVELHIQGSEEYGIAPHPAPDLLARYTRQMEIQLNANPDLGTPTNERNSSFVSSSGERYWNVRVPRLDGEAACLDFCLPRFVQSAGMTGWDFVHKVSRFLGFDFDSIANHKEGISDAEMDRVQQALMGLDFVEVRRSSSGKGLHVYVHVDAIPTADHAEHAVLARAVLSLMSEAAGFDFYAGIDCCGGVMWFISDKCTPENGGFTLLKSSTRRLAESDLPEGWRDFVPRGRDGKHGSTPAVLSSAGKLLMDRLAKTKYVSYWNEHAGIVTHKCALLEVQKYYPGNFHTSSPGNKPAVQNCWLRERDDGSWTVISWAPDADWEVTSRGYSRSTFGNAPSFQRANLKGTPESKSCYRYSIAADAVDAIRQLTGEQVGIPDSLKDRQYDVVNKHGVFQLRVHKKHANEDCPDGWCNNPKFFWLGRENVVAESTSSRIKDQFFQCEQQKRMVGLFRYHSGMKYPVQLTRIEAIGTAASLLRGDSGAAVQVINDATANPWQLTCTPFKPFVDHGSKTLNVGAQLKVAPKQGRCDTWLKMLLRIGDSLTPYLVDPDQPWADWVRQHRVTSGGRWLLHWCAWMFQHPEQRVPGLALTGPGESGKSTFPDALQALLDDEATADAETILAHNSQFTGPIATAVLARIEELDVSSKAATAKLKNLITAKTLKAEFKGKNPFYALNCLRYISTCNDPSFIPVFDGDSRLVVIELQPLEDDDKFFHQRLMQEAPAFVWLCQHLKLPEVYSRLALPPIVTEMKDDLLLGNMTEAERFATECIEIGDGFSTNAELFDAYRNWSDMPIYSDAQTLLRELRAWFSYRGIGPAHNGKDRGRKVLIKKEVLN